MHQWIRQLAINPISIIIYVLLAGCPEVFGSFIAKWLPTEHIQYTYLSNQSKKMRYHNWLVSSLTKPADLNQQWNSRFFHRITTKEEASTVFWYVCHLGYFNFATANWKWLFNFNAAWVNP